MTVSEDTKDGRSMMKKWSLAILLAVVFSMTVLSTTLSSVRATNGVTTPTPAFEYLFVKTGQLFTTPIDDVQKIVNAAGLQGWELVDFDLPNTALGTPTHSLWSFKRPSEHPNYEGTHRLTPLTIHYPSDYADEVIRWYDEQQN